MTMRPCMKETWASKRVTD
uniref:Uncharacterized protein n=1 Tax=Anguilla anguilla TaxID=7936 RepID=A0A0E9W0D8_ANGAN